MADVFNFEHAAVTAGDGGAGPEVIGIGVIDKDANNARLGAGVGGTIEGGAGAHFAPTIAAIGGAKDTAAKGGVEGVVVGGVDGEEIFEEVVVVDGEGSEAAIFGGPGGPPVGAFVDAGGAGDNVEGVPVLGRHSQPSDVGHTTNAGGFFLPGTGGSDGGGFG